MHRLDNVINDIEPRIVAICNNAPKVEEPSLQEALTAYGWVLLDSWIAWRTLRFLLRETEIDEKVNDKWFQTPSSYTASQLKAIWNFTEDTMDYLEKTIGKSFKNLIDSTVQSKRNSCAHFSRKSEITGADSQEIKKIYGVLSKTFLLYENAAFAKKMIQLLEKEGYDDFYILYPNETRIEINKFTNTIEMFSLLMGYECRCYKDTVEYSIFFNQDGCKAGRVVEGNHMDFVDVPNQYQSKYCFLSNKGFYLKTSFFVSAVKDCWKKLEIVSNDL